MLDIVVMVSGGGTNLQAIIDGINNGSITNTRITGVISNKEDAYALERAKANGIAAVCVNRKKYDTLEAFQDALKSAVDSFKPQLIVLAGFLVILPEILISDYSGRILNIHPSLIPSFCGAGFYGLRVHKEVLARGCKVTGATVHFVDNGTDTGPILLQKSVDVLWEDTPESLQLRVMQQAEWVILPKAINTIANNRIESREGKYRIIE